MSNCIQTSRWNMFHECLLYMFIITEITCFDMNYDHGFFTRTIVFPSNKTVYETVNNNVFPKTYHISEADFRNKDSNGETMSSNNLLDEFAMRENEYNTKESERRSKILRKYKDYKEPSGSGSILESILSFLDSILEMILFPFYKGKWTFLIS